MSLLTRASAPLALATACLFLVQATDAEAQRRRPRQSEGTEVTVQNRGQGALSFLYVAPVGEGAWGEDRLGSDTVARNRNFRFTIEGEQCRFDVRGVFENGREETRFGIDLCARPELVMNGRTQTTAADLQRQGPVALYLVRNRSGNTMQTLKLVSANGDESEDVLGSTTVETNSQYTGRFERNAGCVYDLVATFEGSSERTLRRRDLCATREVVFGTGADDPAPRAGAEERRNEQDAQPPLAVTIQNRGAVAIQYLHIRPRGTNNWGPDRLGSDTVEARGTFQLSLPRRGCDYDVKVRFSNDREEVRNGVNLCTTPEFVVEGPALAPGRGERKQTASARPAQPAISQVAIINEGDRTIESLFISSSKISSWGEDLLGAERIQPGARYTARVERDDQCNYDLRIVYTGGREERRMRQNLCQRREVAFGGANAFRVDGGGPDNGRRMVFTNSGRGAVREVYLTPTNDTHWGDDRLGSELLPPRFRLEMRLPTEGGCRWDLKVVYEGGQNIEKRDQDLCATPEMAIGRAGRPGQVVSTGTGFYINDEGFILTNHHVIDGCATVAISRPGGARIPLRLIGADEGADLAVLRQENTTSTPLRLRTGAGPVVRGGERVVLVGYPARSQLGGVNVTEGIVSGLRGALGDQSRFQYTAPTQPGNSGGPVLDGSGSVVGVVVSQIDKISGERTAQNINFGIKLDLVRTFLAANNVQAAEGESGAPLATPDILQNADQSVLPLDCLE
jgi:S1-C subfamily serine protease